LQSTAILFTVKHRPGKRQFDHDARPAPSPLPQSSVILNAVKDLRLPLRVSKWRDFRVAEHTPATPDQAEVHFREAGLRIYDDTDDSTNPEN